MAENENKISQIQVGDTTYDICDAVARSHIITDQNYRVIDTLFPTSSETVGENTYTRGLYVQDSEGVDRSYIRNIALADGNLQGVQVEALRIINNTNKFNNLRLMVDGNGNPVVGLSSSASWLTALGLSDSWHTLTLNSAAQPYNGSAGHTPKYRKQGNVVNIIGGVGPKTALTAGASTTLTIGVLPAGYRPPLEVITLCQGSGESFWFLRIKTDGTLVAERYRNRTGYADIPTNAWLYFNVTFFTA